MPEESLIEEMRAAVRGDRERARQRQLASGAGEPAPFHTAAAPENERSAPEPDASPSEPAPPRRRLWFRRRSQS